MLTLCWAGLRESSLSIHLDHGRSICPRDVHLVRVQMQSNGVGQCTPSAQGWSDVREAACEYNKVVSIEELAKPPKALAP